MIAETERCQDFSRGMLGWWQRLREILRWWQRHVRMVTKRCQESGRDQERDVGRVAEGCGDGGRGCQDSGRDQERDVGRVAEGCGDGSRGCQDSGRD